jgi:Kef-type K+ transport system membrane component KefB
MQESHLIFSIFLIFAGAAVLSTVALVARQSMLVAYVVLGILLGPSVLGWVGNAETVQTIGDVGIIFLLFLLGLHLPPQKLFLMLKKLSLVGIVSSLIFLAIGFGVAYLFNYSIASCWVIGASMMFSSTIIGIKLLPTTILHHQHTGEVMIGVLLFQDIVAIIALLLVHGAAGHGSSLLKLGGMVLIGFPVVCVIAFLLERFVIIKLLVKFDRVREYMFLVAIAWCLALSQLASFFNLSGEIGAFVAGVVLASSPIALYIAESLRPIRDFFLVMFFFSVGAGFNLHYLPAVIAPALILVILMMISKPVVYWYCLHKVGETKTVSWEVGVRLSQISEFSLIIAAMAFEGKIITSDALYLVQAVTIITFMISSYWVVMRYPTPLALDSKMQRD